MSTKICVAPVRPEWRDSVTLGQLSSMMDALYGMGYDVDTPVTYLFNDRHVWLETVHDVDDDDLDIEVEAVEPEPRVWKRPNQPPPGVVAEDNYGTRWKWLDGRRYAWVLGEWDAGIEIGVDDWFPRHISKLTEVLS